MSSDTKFFLGVAGAAVVAVILFMVFGHGGGVTGDTASIDYSKGIKVGSDSAPVKIVEFGDFQCPACGQAAKPLRDTYEKNKDVAQLIFIHFPLPIHKNSTKAALAAEAANSQNKFWEMYDLLYQNQTAWSEEDDPNPLYVSYAKQLSLDEKKFTLDLDSSSAKNRINDDGSYGTSLGVNQTPTFYVNGKKVVGAQSSDQWQKLIGDNKQK